VLDLPSRESAALTWRTKKDTRHGAGEAAHGCVYRAENGDEPVRDWLRSLPVQDRKRIGADIKAVELLHGFERKSQKTPAREIDRAMRRMKGLER
jgi:phage-related protein